MNPIEELEKDTEKKYEYYSSEPLSDLEIKKLRRILETEAFSERLRSTIWVWTRAVLITIGSIYFVREWLGDVLTWIVKLIK